MNSTGFSLNFGLFLICCSAIQQVHCQDIFTFQEKSAHQLSAQQFGLIQASSASEINPYVLVEAEDFSSQSGVQVLGVNNVSGIAQINHGDYVVFEDVAFGNGPQGGGIRASSNTMGGMLEFRLDSLNGAHIATAEVVNTGAWTSFEIFPIEVINPAAFSSGDEVLGTRDLYMVFVGGSGFLMAIDKFRFTPAPVAPQQINITDCPTSPVALGDTLALNIATVPPSASAQALSFTVDNPSLISFTNGVYTAAALGEFTVTVASTFDASVVDVCTFVIAEPIAIEDFRVLVYHETNGFRHGSIDAGIAMIEEFGMANDWIVEESQSSAIFSEANLATASVVVWLNTSGNGLLSAEEQEAFEQYIQGGGGFVGVHAATDTYRDGSWPWYNDLVGAIVQTGPNHTSNNFNATMDVVGSHPAVEHLDLEWNKNEEYYYWELNGGYLFDGNIDLLQVRSTGDQTYDAPRPITWYKFYDGGRSFYSALGHNSSDYSGDEDFRTMVEHAILWAGGEIDIVLNTGNGQVVNGEHNELRLLAYPNPTDDVLNIHSHGDQVVEGTLRSISGTMLRKVQGSGNLTMSLADLKSGMYLLHIRQGGQDKRLKIVKR